MRRTLDQPPTSRIFRPSLMSRVRALQCGLLVIPLYELKHKIWGMRGRVLGHSSRLVFGANRIGTHLDWTPELIYVCIEALQILGANLIILFDFQLLSLGARAMTVCQVVSCFLNCTLVAFRVLASLEPLVNVWPLLTVRAKLSSNDESC